MGLEFIAQFPPDCSLQKFLKCNLMWAMLLCDFFLQISWDDHHKSFLMWQKKGFFWSIEKINTFKIFHTLLKKMLNFVMVFYSKQSHDTGKDFNNVHAYILFSNLALIFVWEWVWKRKCSYQILFLFCHIDTYIT